jgi:3,5-epimerase/4-reductase
MIYKDNRGYNLQIPFNIIIKEQMLSFSKKNVLRGIHKSPYGKLVTLLSGKIIDYVINFDNNNIIVNKYILEFDKERQIYIPPNHGHLFIALEDSHLLYQFTGNFDPLTDQNIHYLDPYINLDIDNEIQYIISEKDSKSDFLKPIDYVILGSNGFLGSETCKYLKYNNKNFITLNTRLENYDKIKLQLELYKPKYLICSAGISGKPSISWCESHEKETFEINYLHQINLAQICNMLNIHLTIYVSGSIYKYNNKLNNEDSIPDNYDFIYCKYRIYLENILKIYNNILLLRIQYPISFTDNKLCFMNKTLTRLNTINNQNINITFIPELFSNLHILIENNTTGIINFVNPGIINITELVELYKKYKDNNLLYNITNNSPTCGLLDTTKLSLLLPNIKNIKESLENYFVNN